MKNGPVSIGDGTMREAVLSGVRVTSASAYSKAPGYTGHCPG